MKFPQVGMEPGMSRTELNLKAPRRPGKEALSSQIDGLAYLICPPPELKPSKRASKQLSCQGCHPIKTKSARQKGLSFSSMCPFLPLSQHPRRRRSAKTKLNQKCDAQTSFRSLPLEIVQKIFSYFPQRELCLLAQVCKAWRDFVYDPIHWQRLSFELNHNLEHGILQTITERTPLLKKLSLHGRENLTVSEEVRYFTKRCSLLQELDLSYMSTIDSLVIEVLTENCSRLQSLSIEGCVLVDHRCVSLMCQKLCGLHNLNLSGCSSLLDDSIMLLASSLSHIHRLNIDGIPGITDRAITELARHQRKTLECLHVDGTEATDCAVSAIAQCSRVKHLCLSNADNLTDAALVQIQRMPCLRELRLRKATNVSSAGLRRMFLESGLQSLSHLDLTECCVLDDSCVLALAQCCGNSLIHLVLSLCWNITDVGLQAIVSGCRKIQHLDLLGLDHITGEPLQKIPEVLPTLIFIDLRQCSKINDELMIEVIKKKPTLTILNYYGEEFRPTLESKDSRSIWMATHLKVLIGFLFLEMLLGLICLC